MANQKKTEKMPQHVAAIAEGGFVTWAGNDVDPKLRERFHDKRIPVAGIRNVRVWGLQVDDERELPGHERTQIPDDEIWEINLEAKDGSHYAVDSRMLKTAK